MTDIVARPADELLTITIPRFAISELRKMALVTAKAHRTVADSPFTTRKAKRDKHAALSGLWGALASYLAVSLLMPTSDDEEPSPPGKP